MFALGCVALLLLTPTASPFATMGSTLALKNRHTVGRSWSAVAPVEAGGSGGDIEEPKGGGDGLDLCGVWRGRHVSVVTTASLPWMTGTSVNPLLRAVELAKRGAVVTLMLPWLDPTTLDDTEGQPALYGSHRFRTPEEQEAWIRAWIRDSAMEKGEAEEEKGGFALRVSWYPGRYCPGIGSVIHDARGGGDILQFLPPGEERDVAILEEPEHLSWYHAGGRWGDHYDTVIGIVHTDYVAYALAEGKDAECKALVTRTFQGLAYAAHCDALVCLSATLLGSGVPSFVPEEEEEEEEEEEATHGPLPSGPLPSGPRTVVANVHGVRPEFLRAAGVGRGRTRRRRNRRQAGEARPVLFYLLAKKLWAKGYRELIHLLSAEAAAVDAAGGEAGQGGGDGSSEAAHPHDHRLSPGGLRLLDTHGPIALVGSGPEEEAIAAEAHRVLGPGRVTLLPAMDHAALRHAPDEDEDDEDDEEEDDGSDGGHEAAAAAAACGEPFSVFVNPSTSEVLCTATAEALAMGKTVVLPRHPSNDFFMDFANCKPFDSGDPASFLLALEEAATAPPLPLSETERHRLSWAAATDRLSQCLLTATAAAPSAHSAEGLELVAASRQRPTAGLASWMAHQINLIFRRGLLGKVMHYDYYMVLEAWDETDEWASRAKALQYLFKDTRRGRPMSSKVER